MLILSHGIVSPTLNVNPTLIVTPCKIIDLQCCNHPLSYYKFKCTIIHDNMSSHIKVGSWAMDELYLIIHYSLQYLYTYL